jgi:DNA polymerase-4
MVEQISIDEAFMDVSDDPLGGEEVARRLQNEILERFGLPTSWGVASNKLVAKIATEVGKPRGLVVVPPGEEATFLAPLPVGMLWGVGPKTSGRLAELGVKTIGDLAALSAERLRGYFGVRGQDLATRAAGIDDRSVVEDHEARSMSAETTFSKDVTDGDELRGSLRRLSERVGARLRKAELAGRTVRIKLRWPDFSTITRQTRLDNPTDQDGEIYRSVKKLFDKEWRAGRAVRLLGVGVADLGPPVRQLRLFDRSWEQDSRLLRALDEIKAKYGRDAVRRGSRKHRFRESITDESKGSINEESEQDDGLFE